MADSQLLSRDETVFEPDQIVCPASASYQTIDEALTYFPDLQVELFYGAYPDCWKMGLATATRSTLDQLLIETT